VYKKTESIFYAYLKGAASTNPLEHVSFVHIFYPNNEHYQALQE
jgi:hypothetical protein